MPRRQLLALLCLSSGCGPRLLEEEVEGLRHVWTEVRSNGSGTAKVDLPVDAGETALLATVAVDPPNRIHVRTLYDPQGASVFSAFEWSSSPYSKSNAAFVADTVSLNWPVLAEDPGLSAGRYTFELGVVDEQQRYSKQSVRFDAYLKSDPAFDAGALSVSIVYVDGLEGDDAVRAAVDEAKTHWIELYAPIGLAPSFEDYSYDVAGVGPPMDGLEPAYVEIADATPVRTVNLVIAEDIDGLAQIFGIAGDIPGPLASTTRSGVQINATMAAGPDGEFDPEDVRLLAETMAHEILHFVGLYHPVETDWLAYDVLGDTPECSSQPDCADALGDNLMFPYPVCGITGCVPQDILTDDQGAVANRYVGVD